MVRVSGYGRVITGHGNALCSFAITGYRWFTVQLHDPVGHRTVRTPDSHDPIPLVSGPDVPAPTHLPPGYVPRGLDVINALGPDRIYRNGPYELDVVVVTTKLLATAQPPPNPTVHGPPAHFTADARQTILDWTAADGHSYELRDYVRHDAERGQPDVGRAQLLRVADSIP